MPIQDQFTEHIRLGSFVVIHYPDKNLTQTIQVVPPSESAPFQGKISISSPLPQALLGRRAGESVELKAPGGLIRMHIKEVIDP